MSPMSTDRRPYLICIPIYNDWESAATLIGRIDERLAERGTRVEVLLVDDGSSARAPNRLAPCRRQAVSRVDVLSLRRNLGHQRAIAVGLSYIQQHREHRGVIVMDGDGEDTPDGVVRLLDAFEQHGGRVTVFAKRARRTESLAFKGFYVLFKIIHQLLIGRTTNVGNFSVLPAEHLDRLVGVSELWNHYAAAVFQAQLPLLTIPIDRGHRISGSSKMNFVSLVMHGLSAISVFGNVVGIRLLVASGALALLAFVGVTVVVMIRFGTAFAIPGWATSATGVLVIVLLQAFQLSMVFVFITLQGRTARGFLPIRDYSYYVGSVSALPHHG